MEIRELSAADIADDALMREWYDLTRRSQLHGREQAPFWTFEEFLGGVRSPDSGERVEMFTARDEGRLVGTARMFSTLLDNLDKAWFGLDVDPEARRHGHGTRLLDLLSERARQDGRTLLLTDCKVPYADREGHVSRRFADATGCELANYEVVRHCRLPLPEDQLDAWAAEAAERHEGYRIQTYVNQVPEEFVQGLCTLIGQIAVDAPTGAVEFEEEVLTPERFAEELATVAAMGRDRLEAIALAPDGTVAAQSTLAAPRPGSENQTAFQWGTFVHREHRGRRLGLAVKVANLRALQAADPEAALVVTQNAETNGYMVDINEKLGFEAVEVSAEYLRRL